jgi:acetyl esterase/lipase
MKIALLLLAAMAAPITFAQETVPLDLPLYSGVPDGGVPLSALPEVLTQKPGDPIVRVEHVQTPDMRVFLPPVEKRTGAACVIYPGGAYGILAIDHEGYQIAKLLNEWGIAGIVVKYRVTNKEPGAYKYPVPLLDGRQGIRQTRAHAKEWGIDPNKIGVLGFSAGGHLASCMAALSEKQLPTEDAKVFAEKQHVANWAVLVYPVIGVGQAHGHGGSQQNLLGKDPDPSVIDLMNTARHVSSQTPPTFLVSTIDDRGVPPQNSMSFYQAMFEHKVPGELHIWEKGGHGYGILADRGEVATEWPIRLKKWLAGRGLAR